MRALQPMTDDELRAEFWRASNAQDRALQAGQTLAVQQEMKQMWDAGYTLVQRHIRPFLAKLPGTYWKFLRLNTLEPIKLIRVKDALPHRIAGVWLETVEIDLPDGGSPGMVGRDAHAALLPVYIALEKDSCVRATKKEFDAAKELVVQMMAEG